MALLFVLWLVMVLTAVAFELRYASHLRMQVSANIGTQKKALFCARSGIEQVVADLIEERDRPERESEDGDAKLRYCNVEIGDGVYTLYAGEDDQGQPCYGPMDACAKINVNTADASTLERIPGVGGARAADIVALRGAGGIQAFEDLLQIEDVTETTLFGEDRNRNGILDPNENDGDAAWPPDDADGRLNAGWSAYLTLWSGARDVSSSGETRINLNTASEEAMRKAVSDISAEQAAAIVAHRGERKFSSAVDLLDVEYVVEAPNTAQPGQNAPGQPRQDARQPGQNAQNQAGNANKPQNQANNPPPQSQGQTPQKPVLRKTGVKAFDEAAFRRVADRVTVSDDEAKQGVININTASAAVLACLPGISEELADAIAEYRQGLRDRFKSPADLLDVRGVSVETLRGVYALIAARSDVYEIHSFGTVNGWQGYAGVTAFVVYTDDTVHIVSWRVIG